MLWGLFAIKGNLRKNLSPLNKGKTNVITNYIYIYREREGER